MQKNEAFKRGDSIIRVLNIQDDQALIVSYPQKSVPVWINRKELDGYQLCNESDIPYSPDDFEALSPNQRRIAHERYTLIAGILPFIGDERQRCAITAMISEEKGVSKSTLRRYLHQYLPFRSSHAFCSETAGFSSI